MELNGTDREYTNYWGEGGPCPSATLSTTNPPLTDLRLNNRLRGKVRANTRLYDGTACICVSAVKLA